MKLKMAHFVPNFIQRFFGDEKTVIIIKFECEFESKEDATVTWNAILESFDKIAERHSNVKESK